MKVKSYTPNPQGKGLVPVLEELGGRHQTHLNDGLMPKQIDQVQMELFTAMFVLQSDFTFNPVPLRSYWLYLNADKYSLMLVGPDEWISSAPGRFVGECILQTDRTWSLALADELEADEDFIHHIESERKKLQLRLETADSIEEVLPTYERSFSFYSRILAFSLGKSLDISMQLSGIKGLNYQEAKGLLSHERSE